MYAYVKGVKVDEDTYLLVCTQDMEYFYVQLQAKKMIRFHRLGFDRAEAIEDFKQEVIVALLARKLA